MLRISSLAFAGLISFSLSAQQDAGGFPCATGDDALLEQLTGGDPEALARIAATQAELEAFTTAFGEVEMDGERATHIIPVVFHIIHNNGSENIGNAQIIDAMRILNEDYSRTNPDWSNAHPSFVGIAANVDVEFRLAKKDPNGNCTNGITRTVSSLTNQGDNAMKALIQWPRNRYLNVWVCAQPNGSSSVLGYALLPSAAQWFPTQDGIVIRHNCLGTVGTGITNFSRTLTHEVGHWINLEHPWGPTNNPGVASNCNSDDGVADTPNTIGWQTCNVNGSSCNSLDNVENFMEYSFCSKMFTNGQKTRMIAALNSTTAQRNQLSQAQNLSFTGVTSPDVPCAAVFSPSPVTICAGGTVTFNDQSYHGITQRNWSFPGGTPSSSTQANPVVTYNAPGVYAVSLTVGDGSTQVSSTLNGHVTVLAAPGAAVPVMEGFEPYANFDASPWTVVNPNGNNTWSITNAAAFSGDKSTRILNTAAMNGQTDDLISGTYDMSSAQQVVVTYRYAYAQRNSGSDDRLRVYVSNNCGATWSMRQQLRGTQTLNTVGAPMTASFVPNGQGQWGYSEVNNIAPIYHVNNFRLRFEFESYGGNNIYLDDININGQPVGVEEIALGGGGLLVVPNPAAGQAQAVIHLDKAGRTELDLIDVLGRTIATPYQGHMAAGTHRMDLPIGGLTSGVYFLRLRTGMVEKVARFIVE
ncbi:MAG: T9SS type A sorting domain-containing protein [Flavobacteriales bacterium]|nr:T9SS type A sorting domain-containing protein [Flavobacteriales bacterium]